MKYIIRSFSFTCMKLPQHFFFPGFAVSWENKTLALWIHIPFRLLGFQYNLRTRAFLKAMEKKK